MREHSKMGIDERLAGRAVPPATRREVIATLERTGLLDDTRFARTRAEAMAGRGYGDAAIAADLHRSGIDPELAGEAVASLEPETERAAGVVRRRGVTPRTARFLRSKGFSLEAVEAACGADFANDP